MNRGSSGASATDADAYCTAVSVMAPEDGLKFVESRPELEAVILLLGEHVGDAAELEVEGRLDRVVRGVERAAVELDRPRRGVPRLGEPTHLQRAAVVDVNHLDRLQSCS